MIWLARRSCTGDGCGVLQAKACQIHLAMICAFFSFLLRTLCRTLTLAGGRDTGIGEAARGAARCCPG